MSIKSFQHLSYLSLLSSTLILNSFTPEILAASAIEPGMNSLDANLSDSDSPTLTPFAVSPTMEEGAAQPIEWSSLNTARDTSPPAPLLQGEGSLTPPFREEKASSSALPPHRGDRGGWEGGLGGLGQPYPGTIESSLPSQGLGQEMKMKTQRNGTPTTTPQTIAQQPPIDKPPSLESPQEPQPLPTLPPPDQLLPQPSQTPTPLESPPEGAPATLTVKRFEFVGNTVFSSEELSKVLANYTNRQISFTELLQARSQITKYYVDRGYVTSGAILPPQSFNRESGVLTLQIIEGSVENINITGTRRLKPGYISSRLAIATKPPLNINKLLNSLQLLQLDPLIQNLSADLQAGTRLGTNILDVKVTEADTFNTSIDIDNSRSPSVGSIRRRISLNEANLLGFGDSLTLGYTNTDGSNGGDISYTIPVNPYNGKVSLNVGLANSNVIESPFDRLDISSKSRYYELSFRQPIIQTPTQELNLGLTLSHQRSQTFLGIDEIGPFPLSPGADEQGRTRASAVRFFQEWTKRSSQDVLAFRSQFSLGLNVLGATINNNGEPDSRFFAWRGQGQWARLLAPDTLLLLKTDMQLSDHRLLGLEQFGIGGQATVRGYRQDFLLKDNGLLASAEVRLPILRVPQVKGLLQVAPFFDLGTAWNNGNESSDAKSPNTLLSTGLGLLWRMGDDFTARLDFGIPLVSLDQRGDTWQEKGIYFSIIYTPF
jgi:hemolysin activation/secretion protein